MSIARPWTAGYELAFLDYIRWLARPGCYVDVGAHLGTHTVWFARMCPSTVVHAVEPSSSFAQLVQRNADANGVGAKVRVHQVGVSDRAGHATNWIGREHHIGLVDQADDQVEGLEETFEVVRLDDLVTGPVAVLKIDVEGMEPEVLRGATRILDDYRPVVFTEAWTPKAARDLGRVLKPFGYRATGQIFNATPTYEFSTDRAHLVRMHRLRSMWRRLPTPVRAAVRRLR